MPTFNVLRVKNVKTYAGIKTHNLFKITNVSLLFRRFSKVNI